MAEEMNYPGMGTQIPAKKERPGISGSTLKIIAIVTMLIDHIGASVLGRLLQTHGINELNVADISALTQWMADNAVLFWSYTIMRMIGRVAFPIFCFLLIQGFLHTHDVKKYAARLLAFALISELPFDLAFKGKIDFSYQNVFFTLFIGLMTMIAFRWIEEHTDWSGWQRVILYIAALACGIVVAELLQTDYAGKGVVCIMALYIFRKTKVQQIIAGCVAFCWELTAPIAFLPIAFYNGKRGLQIKYFFYAFYPVHLLILYLVVCLMGMGNMPAM